MATIDARGIINFGRTPGGDQFTYLVDQLIRAQCRVGGVPLSAIHTNLRSNSADGGVDSKIDLVVLEDTTGWFGAPTVWQYKATGYAGTTEADLRREIRADSKEYVRQCLRDGFAYRYCICDDMPVREQDQWARWLTACVREINPAAPPTIVITAGDLAAWANRFPPLVAIFAGGRLHELAQHFHSWGKSARGLTPNYIPVPEWDDTWARIREHVQMAVTPHDPVLAVQGVAGVGKTRLVYEVLASEPGLESFVYYTSDEKAAQEMARQLANDESQTAILVADECSLQARASLTYIMQGHMGRIRAVAIDNSGVRSPSGAPEYWLERFSDETLLEILNQNFSPVPPDHRRAYADFANGFVRLAADLCRRDPQITAMGSVEPALTDVADYLQRRLLRPGDLEVVQALALVTRVGYKSDVAHELDELCVLTGLDRRTVLSVVNRLHDVPGFIAKGGQYLYITPEIIAQVAFDAAWRHWCKDDPAAFLAAISPSLVSVFMDRVTRSASEEVRRIVGGAFRRWASGFAPRQLAEPAAVHTLVTLADIDPTAYLARLRAIIEDARIEDLGQIDRASGAYAVRRPVVWLAERLAAFPEYFDDAEAILLRLAIAENEPNIVNNATGIWRQLFRIGLSGTAVPFPRRLSLLRDRIYAWDARVSSLALSALDAIFERTHTRTAGPSVVGGRLLPPEWRPTSREELSHCLALAVDLLVELSNGGDRFGQKPHDIAIRHMRALLVAGRLAALEKLFAVDKVSDDVRVRAVTAVETCLRYDVESPNGYLRAFDTYVAAIRSWLEELKPIDTHGRLLTVVGVNPWHATIRGRQEQWQDELRALARYLLEHRPALEQELGWLMSDAAVSAWAFGYELGKLDSGGALLGFLIDAGARYGSTGLARGYIGAIANVSPIAADRLNQLIDDIESRDPLFAYHLSTAAPTIMRAFARTVRLVDAGKLAPTFLQGFLMTPAGATPDVRQFSEALDRLVGAAEGGDTGAAQSAIDAVAYSVQQDAGRAELLANERIRGAMWRLLDVATDLGGEDAYNWRQVLAQLVSLDPGHAARLAVTALLHDRLDRDEEAKAILIEMATSYPDVVMESLGSAILEDGVTLSVYLDNYKDLIAALPAEVVERWLHMTGVAGARRLARHLPIPYFDADGEIVVPALTYSTLAWFGGDERVFNEFLAGTHFFGGYTDELRAQYECRLKIARKLLAHPLAPMHRWAGVEEEYASRLMGELRQQEEEQYVL